MKALEILKERGEDDELYTELYERYLQDANRTGPPAAYPTFTAALRSLDYTPKRLTKEARERDAEKCDAWLAAVKRRFKSSQLICVDEVGSDKRTTNRNVGHSKRGTRATGKQHFHKGRRYSALGVYTCDSAFVDAYIVKGGFNSALLRQGVERAVLPHMNPYPGENSVLVWDGASIHGCREVIEMVLDTGALVLFLEPYDPQHMPIEIGFRALKKWMRKHRELIMHMPPREQLRLAFLMVHKRAGKSSFLECGYDVE